MRYLLFSECLQNDFVAPMNAGAPLPNELHIGRAESRRLLGDPEGPWTEEGPLARFLSAFLTGAGRDHASVHIRDWHDPEDPATRTHLEHFGSHCVRGTRGAEFVVPFAPILNAGGLVVDSEVLSDFVGTTLEQTLRPLLNGPVRAGIIGVWTDFKVQYLAYELQTRLGLRDVAVCSALTASRSRLAHRQALEHMTTEQVLRRTEWPVLAVPADAVSAPVVEHPGVQLKKILLANVPDGAYHGGCVSDGFHQSGRATDTIDCSRQA